MVWTEKDYSNFDKREKETSSQLRAKPENFFLDIGKAFAGKTVVFVAYYFCSYMKYISKQCYLVFPLIVGTYMEKKPVKRNSANTKPASNRDFLLSCWTDLFAQFNDFFKG